MIRLGQRCLIEIAPHVAPIAVVCDPKTAPTAAAFVPSAQSAACKFGASAFLTAVHESTEIEGAMMMLAREAGGGLLFPPDLFDGIHRKLIAELAARYRIPAVHACRAWPINLNVTRRGSQKQSGWQISLARLFAAIGTHH